MPESASAQSHLIVTSLRYQPLLPNVPLKAGFSVGAVLSSLTIREAVVLLPSLSLATAVFVMPVGAVFALTVSDAGVIVSIPTGSLAVHLTATSLLFQPLPLAEGT